MFAVDSERQQELKQDNKLERQQELEREQERQRQEELERQRREAKQLRRRLRKQLTLLKDVITRDVLLMKNLHSLCKYLLLNLKSSSHNLIISTSHTSLCLVFGIVRLVHLGRTFHNILWVHSRLNIFHFDSLSLLSDLFTAHRSPAGQGFQYQGWCLHNDLTRVFALSLESKAGTVVVPGPLESLI